MKQCCAGIGSYISVHKVLNHDFSQYDGIFTPLLNTKKSKDVFIKPNGQYLCAYFKDPWYKLPDIYIYFSGQEPKFTVPLHFTGTDFQNKV